MPEPIRWNRTVNRETYSKCGRFHIVPEPDYPVSDPHYAVYYMPGPNASERDRGWVIVATIADGKREAARLLRNGIAA